MYDSESTIWMAENDAGYEAACRILDIIREIWNSDAIKMTTLDMPRDMLLD